MYRYQLVIGLLVIGAPIACQMHSTPVAPTITQNIPVVEPNLSSGAVPYGLETVFYGFKTNYLHRPISVVMDRAGNFYVVDSGQGIILKFSPTQHYIGQWGSQGSGPGQLNNPLGIAISSNGILYVADAGNNRIEAFTTRGVWVGAWTQTLQGTLNAPSGVAVDAYGNIYVADTLNNQVVKLNASGVPLAEWTQGSNGVTLKEPEDVALGPHGNVYVTNSIYNTPNSQWEGAIQKFSEMGQPITEWSNTNQTSHGPNFLSAPYGITTNSDGDIFVTDLGNTTFGNMGVDEFTSTGTFVRFWDQWNQNGTSMRFSSPHGIAMTPSGNLEIADIGGGYLKSKSQMAGANIYQFTEEGQYLSSFQSNWGHQSKQDFAYPKGLAMGPNGNLYVASGFMEYQVDELGAAGEVLLQFGSLGIGPGQFHPAGIAVNASGDIYVTDLLSSRVEIFNPQGTFLEQFGSFGTAPGDFEFPVGIAIGSTGNVYVADTDNNRIEKFTSNGTYITSWLTNTPLPYGILIFNHQVYVVCRAQIPNQDQIEEFTETGQLERAWGTEGSGPGQLDLPYAMAADPQGNLLITDENNNRVDEFSSQGTYLTSFGAGQLNSPLGITTDDHGDVYISSSNSIAAFREQN
jgi:streptogramin lyase